MLTPRYKSWLSALERGAKKTRGRSLSSASPDVYLLNDCSSRDGDLSGETFFTCWSSVEWLSIVSWQGELCNSEPARMPSLQYPLAPKLLSSPVVCNSWPLVLHQTEQNGWHTVIWSFNVFNCNITAITFATFLRPVGALLWHIVSFGSRCAFVSQRRWCQLILLRGSC